MAEEELTAVVLAGGHPELLLERQLAWLRAAGFEAVVLCLPGEAEEVRARFGDGSRLGVKLRYFVEDMPLGSAGTVKALGAASLPEHVLVLRGELGVEGDIRAMLKAHRERAAAATLAVHPCPGRGSHANCSRVALGPFRAILDLPPASAAGRATALSPLWVLNRSLLHLVADSGPSDFIRDVFPAALRRGERLFAYPLAGARKAGRR